MALRVPPLSALLRAATGAVGAAAGGRRGTKSLDWYIRATAAAAASPTAPTEVLPTPPRHGRKRARAYLDFAFADAPAGTPPSRVIVELADDLLPTTVTNFLALCEGRVTPPATAAAVPPPSPPGYVGCDVFSVRKGLGFITGDFARNDGRGGWRAGGSPTSPHFADENFTVRHAAAGVLTMANTGVHRNASAFMISTAPAPHLDGRNVAFGRVLAGMDVVRRIGGVYTTSGRPASRITIAGAGRVGEDSADWLAADKAVAAAAAAAAVKPPAAAGGKGGGKVPAPAAGAAGKPAATPKLQ